MWIKSAHMFVPMFIFWSQTCSSDEGIFVSLDFLNKEKNILGASEWFQEDCMFGRVALRLYIFIKYDWKDISCSSTHHCLTKPRSRSAKRVARNLRQPPVDREKCVFTHNLFSEGWLLSPGEITHKEVVAPNLLFISLLPEDFNDQRWFAWKVSTCLQTVVKLEFEEPSSCICFPVTHFSHSFSITLQLYTTDLYCRQVGNELPSVCRLLGDSISLLVTKPKGQVYSADV